MAPLWTLFRRATRRGVEDQDLLSVYRDYGVVPRGFTDDNWNRIPDDLTSYQLVEPGDLVLNKMKAWQGSLGVSALRGIVSPAYFVYRPLRSSFEQKYLHHLLRSRPFIESYGRMSGGVRVDQWDLDPWAFSRLRVPLPSVAEQRAIADFLDRETALIDELIAKQNTLIERLRERRSASAEKLVSDLASHPVRKMKYLYRPSTAVNPGDVQVLSVYRDYGVIPKDSRADNINVTPLDLSRYLLVKPGWLVVNKMKAWQGSLGVSQHLGIVSPDYEVLVQTSTALDPDFVHEVLRSPVYAREFRVRSVGIRPIQWRLYWDQLGQVQVPLPPLSVQRELVARAVQERAEIDALIAKVERHVELARERRSALITAAVTGQIKVGA